MADAERAMSTLRKSRSSAERLLFPLMKRHFRNGNFTEREADEQAVRRRNNLKSLLARAEAMKEMALPTAASTSNDSPSSALRHWETYRVESQNDITEKESKYEASDEPKRAKKQPSLRRRKFSGGVNEQLVSSTYAAQQQQSTFATATRPLKRIRISLSTRTDNEAALDDDLAALGTDPAAFDEERLTDFVSGRASASTGDESVQNQQGLRTVSSRSDCTDTVAPIELSDYGSNDASFELPSDVELALRAARANFPLEAFRWSMPPVLLRSQVYASLSRDPTAADRGLAALIRSGFVRQFALPSALDTLALSRRGGGIQGAEWLDPRAHGGRGGRKESMAAAGQHGDDYLLMLNADFAALARTRSDFGTSNDSYETRGSSLSLARAGSGARNVRESVVERFIKLVLPRWHDVCIPRNELASVLLADDETNASVLTSEALADSPPGVVDALVDEEIGILVRAGLLLLPTAMTGDATGRSQVLWFAIPGVGAFVQSLLAGRRELEQMLERESGTQLSEARLLRRKLRGSKLSMDYHLRDALGRRRVERLAARGADAERSIIRLPMK